VGRLVERFIASPIAPLVRTLMPAEPSPQIDVFGEIMRSTLKPSQARFIQLLVERFQRAETGGKQ
ncbi:MAG TPA: hypothetical protein VKB76_18285, partial [Ktedonobacterales bacterium]|nr:hypothetical protein [Ktedonobacterales bacterium]